VLPETERQEELPEPDETGSPEKPIGYQESYNDNVVVF
jgi:hypothetical protein